MRDLLFTRGSCTVRVDLLFTRSVFFYEVLWPPSCPPLPLPQQNTLCSLTAGPFLPSFPFSCAAMKQGQSKLDSSPREISTQCADWSAGSRPVGWVAWAGESAEPGRLSADPDRAAGVLPRTGRTGQSGVLRTSDCTVRGIGRSGVLPRILL